jgi:DNA-binding NarL/FixJ family response regulator
MSRPDITHQVEMRELPPGSAVPVTAEDAVRIWSELAMGQWQVVAATDHGDVRHLTISRTARSRAPAWEMLSVCEKRALDLAARGTPQKVIALELGWSQSSVCEVLAGVSHRLGFASLAQLSRAYRTRGSIEQSMTGAGR